MAATVKSTAFAISGIAVATAAATVASSLLMILRMRSVGYRSISTEFGFRRSAFIAAILRHVVQIPSRVSRDNDALQWGDCPSWPGGVAAPLKIKSRSNLSGADGVVGQSLQIKLQLQRRSIYSCHRQKLLCRRCNWRPLLPDLVHGA